MTDKPNAFHTLGLELTDTALLGAQLTMKKGKVLLDSLYDFPYQEGIALQLNADMETALDKNLVISMIPSAEVLVRQLELKLKKEADIDSVLAFQSEPLLPYPPEMAIIDRIKIGETSDGTLLNVIAAKKEHVQEHIQEWNKLEIEPESITAEPAALATFAGFFNPTDQPQFVVHLSATRTVCILVREGKLIAAQSFDRGVNGLIKAHGSSDFNSTDFSEPTAGNASPFYSELQSIRLDLTRTIFSLAKSTKGQEAQHILFVGEGSSLPHVAHYLSAAVAKTSIVPHPTDGIPLTVEQLQKFALPLGAALTGFPKAKNVINFRQQELAYPNPWKRYKKTLAIYIGLCLALAMSFYFLSNAYIAYQEDKLRQEYALLLESLHRPYSEFEREFNGVLKGRKEEAGEVIPAKYLSQEQLMARLSYLEKKMQAAPDVYPLLPNVPTVSDVLAWLVTHPNVVAKDLKTNKLNPLLQIESFSYNIVKRPEQGKKQEKYQVKVEIEFSSPTPKLAREFHDALIAPNALVDPKAEVKWSAARGLYRASFFLKDKTNYPGS